MLTSSSPVTCTAMSGLTCNNGAKLRLKLGTKLACATAKPKHSHSPEIATCAAAGVSSYYQAQSKANTSALILLCKEEVT